MSPGHSCVAPIGKKEKDFIFSALSGTPTRPWGFSLSDNLQTPCAFKPLWVHSPSPSPGSEFKALQQGKAGSSQGPLCSACTGLFPPHSQRKKNTLIFHLKPDPNNVCIPVSLTNRHRNSFPLLSPSFWGTQSIPQLFACLLDTNNCGFKNKGVPNLRACRRGKTFRWMLDGDSWLSPAAGCASQL